ncbi:MAG: hypothetical protein RLO05_03580, partial [Rhodospirillales bacterium]
MIDHSSATRRVVQNSTLQKLLNPTGNTQGLSGEIPPSARHKNVTVTVRNPVVYGSVQPACMQSAKPCKSDRFTLPSA